MATYHCSVKKGKKGYAETHSNYILREDKYSKGKKAEELIYKNYGNLPKWAKKPSDYWKAADRHERKNGNAYYEFEIALPNELPLKENIKIIEQMIDNHIGKNKAYSYAIHEKKAALNNEISQPHVHLMFSEKIQDDFYRDEKVFFSRANPKDPKLGGAKKDNRFTENFSAGSLSVVKIREACEKYINDAYKKNGYNITVSADSLKRQYKKALSENDFDKAELLNRDPEKHLGPEIVYKISENINNFSLKNKEDILSNISEKAIYAYILRELKKAKEEVYLLKQEISNLINFDKEKNEIIDDIKKAQVPTHILGRELIDIINIQIDELYKVKQENLEKLKPLRKTIISDRRVVMIAQSVYTKGRSKFINREYNKISNLKEKYNLAYNEFMLKKKPSKLNIFAYKEYCEEKLKIENWKKDLMDREQKNKKDIDNLKLELTKPDVIEKIDKMINAINEKFKIRHDRITNIIEANKKITNQISELKNIKNEINAKFRNYKFSNSIQRNIGQIKSAISQAREINVSSGIQAKIDKNDRVKKNNQYEDESER